MFYNICPQCGSHLDPSERCDCKRELEKRSQQPEQKKKEGEKDGKVQISRVR